MKVFSDNKKILVTQIISYITFALPGVGKIFDISSIRDHIYFIVVLFFGAQAFMVYFFIQEKKQKEALQREKDARNVDSH